MDIVRTSHFQTATRAVLHVGQAHRKRQVNQLLDRRAISWRIILPWLDYFLVHNFSSRLGLSST
jgi:hypothetical protein